MITVKRPPSNPNVGVLVAQLEKRVPYVVNRGSGYSNPDYRWRWGCSACPFTCENRERELCQAEADAHSCGAAWCAVPITAERAQLLGADPRTPTKEDRERWNRLREKNRIGRA